MKILVLMKMVPDVVEELEVASDGTSLDQEYLRFIVNERDDYALEQALLLKDRLQAAVTVVAPEAPEVEDVLLRHPQIKQAQVIGVPDARLVEVPAAYVILREGGRVTPEDIIKWSKARMANFRVPRYVRIVASFDDIGMTGSAKVQKHKLRAQALIDFGLHDHGKAVTTA